MEILNLLVRAIQSKYKNINFILKFYIIIIPNGDNHYFLQFINTIIIHMYPYVFEYAEHEYHVESMFQILSTKLW